MAIQRKASSAKRSGKVVRSNSRRTAAAKTKWVVLFPTEPTSIPRERIDAAIDAVIARRKQK